MAGARSTHLPSFSLRLRRRCSPWFDLAHHLFYFSSPLPTLGSTLFSGTVCSPLSGCRSLSCFWDSARLSSPCVLSPDLGTPFSGSLFPFISESVLSQIPWPLLSLDLSQRLSWGLLLSPLGSLSSLFGCPSLHPGSLHHHLSRFPLLRAFNLKLKRIVAHGFLSLGRVKLGERNRGVLGL